MLDRHHALALFCAATVVFLAWRDVTIPAVRDTEVWLGLELRDAAARWTAPLHWALYAFAAWAFATRRPWIWSVATAYAALIALSHGVWNLTSPSGGGAFDALWQTALFAAPALALWSARPRGGSQPTS